MQKLVLLLMCLCIISCSKVSNKESNKIEIAQSIESESSETEEVEFYNVEIAWAEGSVYDVKLDDEEIENGQKFNLQSGKTYKIRWIVPSVSFGLSLTYETGGKSVKSSNKETELSGKIGINSKEISFSETSYVYLNGTELEMLPVSDVIVPEEKKEEAEFEIFKTSNDEDVKVVDKTN